MVDRQLLEGWINKADEDFQYAKKSLEEGLEFYPQICFHFHQAAEKYLKTYILAHNLEFKKIHDLGQLLQICMKKDSEFNKFYDAILDLNSYYIETRYPEFAIPKGNYDSE